MTQPFMVHDREEMERRRALYAAEGKCQRRDCNRKAWSLTEEAEMELRPSLADPEQTEIVCGHCCRRENNWARRFV